MRGVATHVTIDGRQIAFSRLDKPLYPSGYTKGQAIEFYLRVAEVMLPHLRRRPVTLKRYPDGVVGQVFYEKDAPRFTPEWVETFPVPRHAGGRDIRYIVIDDLATLAWTVNLANLEMHPFLHCVPRIDRPTQVVFDLDPGEGADVLTCAAVALRLKALLDRLALQSCVKVSGSRGLQIHVPLNVPVTYDTTQAFAKMVAELLSEQHPEQVVSHMAKHLRRGRVFVDWSQNADYKTTVGVYSLRAKQERPFVSMPVAWEELRRALDRSKAAALYFEPDAALKAVKRRGDLFAPVLTVRQTLPADLTRSLRSVASPARHRASRAPAPDRSKRTLAARARGRKAA
jgi:bifunctional non-homologous end joining protein LigD